MSETKWIKAKSPVLNDLQMALKSISDRCGEELKIMTDKTKTLVEIAKQNSNKEGKKK